MGRRPDPRVRVGVAVGARCLVPGGVRVPRSEQPAAEVGVAVDRQFRYAVGVQYEVSKTHTVGTALTLIDAGNAPVNQPGGPLRGTIGGDYSLISCGPSG